MTYRSRRAPKGNGFGHGLHYPRMLSCTSAKRDSSSVGKCGVQAEAISGRRTPCSGERLGRPDPVLLLPLAQDPVAVRAPAGLVRAVESVAAKLREHAF